MDAKARFSDRVADYVKYRPSYPYEAIDAIVAAVHLAPGARVADIGSGTGISSKLFLERGFEVVGVEPNAEMRAAAEGGLSHHGKFQSTGGTAEHTGLEDASVALAIAAQAFHWFQADEARAELRRIVVPPHPVALMWNERLTDTPFLHDYEAALREHSIDYATVNHRDNVTRDVLVPFFAEFETFTVPNAQRFDRKGFIGRALSSSYVPQRGQPKHEAMMQAIDEIFANHQVDGVVEFRYVTSVHVGTV